ncbi:polymer-forming cytoskeletal protein [Janthinobacterium sp. PC23-8]|uniref:polymer-forming cytoskeletal protein n=1 Tax=Janthinobacterium sp. PC23-8 TaxID=2012679 RepID=UPI0011401FE7|nr:polymer-forming cytoskeletal protein [Janthinobacterium sp. PC23-8]
MPDYNNTMVIASGYTVVVPGAISFGYNQSLTMSGTAALIVNGDLDIGNINGPNLNISGGSLTAQGGTFKVGQQAQTLTANVSATNIYLGSGSNLTITGTIVATSLVDIASHATVNGPISGSTVHTNSPVVLNGDVTAKVEFNLASGGRLTGKLVSPTVNIEPSDTRVFGDVTASKSLTLGSGNFISGNVVAGKVELQSSEAYITGNAKVDSIILGWHGRVRQKITCNAFTPSTPCTCVSNNSGYDEGTVNGPSCAAPQVAGPHHFQITHPAAALSCSPEKVTVKACADASCGSAYTNGATVVLAPGGATASTGTTGSVDSTVAQYAGGTATLSLTSTPSTTGALVCKDSTTGNVTNCQMPFNSSGLQVSGNPRYAEDEAIVSISALRSSSNNPRACVPLFAGLDKTIKLRCSYANPATGTLAARIQGKNGTYLSLGASNSSACGVDGTDVLLKFDSDGLAQPNMLYADVGQLGLTATYTSTSGTDNGLTMTGSGNVIVVPAKFAFSAIASPQRAGQEVPSVTVTAQNKAGATTPNFGQETIKPAVALSHGYVLPKFGTQNGNADPEVSGVLGFNNGVLKSSALAWAETGTINITAILNNYLGVQQIGTVTPLATGASNNVLFIPHHFQTALDIVNMPAAGFPALCGAQFACTDNGAGTGARYVYARQPFALKVTAQNLQNATTINFDKQDTSINTQQVQLLARDAQDSANMPPAGSKFTDGSAAGIVLSGVPISAFSGGVARQVLAYQFPGAYSPSAGATSLAAPTILLLRANFTYPVSNVVTSTPSAQGKEAVLTVITGRAMVPNSYGSELLPIRLEVQAQYWDGARWRANLADSLSSFGKANVVLANCTKALVCSTLVVADQVYQFSSGVLAANGRLTLQAPKVAGSVDVSLGGLPHFPSTVGRVVFGVFKSGPVLYIREMY